MKEMPPSTHVRFAVWQCHDKECWMCHKPLRLLDTVTEHVIPKALLKKPTELERVMGDIGLPDDFDVLGFENLLPSCVPCNLKKGRRVFRPSPQIQIQLELLASKASAVRRTAEAVKKKVVLDRVLHAVLVALEERKISMVELENLLADVTRVPSKIGVPADVIILGDGFWYRRASIVAEGQCRCDREACVGAQEKVYCYFHDELSDWVTSTGLYHRCYDELVVCPRCHASHKRGHVGRAGLCGMPFDDQANWT